MNDVLRTLSLALCLGALGLSPVVTRADDVAAKETAAAAVAQDWLKLVDEGRYPESWDAAAAFFKDAVPKEQWVKKVGAVRTPFGKVQKRELKSKKYATSLPGAPDGEYVVLQYETSFAGKKSSVETVTPMLERDGKWHVSGYFVR